MGKKYIIELEDKPFHNGNGDFLYRVKGFNSLVFDTTGVGKLTPYTEPDTEKVREEAKEEGYSIGYDEGREAGVQQGLSDAWDAARTLWNTPNRKEIFGNTTFNIVLTTLTAQEAIEKIRQYEQEQEQIQVGDVVEFYNGEKSVVLVVEDGKPVKLLEADGYTTTVDGDLLSSMKKTGRYFPEISAVLAKMKEE